MLGQWLHSFHCKPWFLTNTELLCLTISRNLFSITFIFFNDPRSFLYSSSLEVTNVIFNSICVNVFEVLHLKIPVSFLVNLLLWKERGFLFHSLCFFPMPLLIWELGFDVKSLSSQFLKMIGTWWNFSWVKPFFNHNVLL